jgi:hypothetical protein
MKTLLLLALCVPVAASAAGPWRAVDARDATLAIRAKARCNLVIDSKHLAGQARKEALTACLADPDGEP